MKRRMIYGLVALALSVNLVIGAKLYLASAQTTEKDTAYPNLELFSYVMEKVRKDYVDGQNLTYQDLVYGALKGMLNTLDPHSEFMDPEKYKELQSEGQLRHCRRAHGGHTGIQSGNPVGRPDCQNRRQSHRKDRTTGRGQDFAR
jgi:C-terminal processing protease CtpA/Prc